MKIWPIILLTFVFSACVDIIKDTVDKVSKTSAVKWSPEIAIPLVYSSLTMQDIIEITDDLATSRIESDQSVTLIYESQLFSLRAEDAFSVPNQYFSENVTLSPSQLTQLGNTGSLTIPLALVLDFDLGVNQVDSILLKDGDFKLAVSTSLQHDVMATLTFKHSALAGNEVEQSLQVSYSGVIPVVDQSSQNISGSAFDLTKTPQGHSQLDVLLTIEVDVQGINPITANEYVNVSYSLEDLKFSKLKGYLPNANLSNGNDSILVKIFDSNEEGSFTLADPKITLDFSNSFGIPLRAFLTEFKGVHAQGNEVALTGYPSQFNVNAASYPGDVSQSSTVLDKNNSNIVSYINNKPYSNIYEYSIYTDPSGPGERVWMLDTSVLVCDVTMDFPLFGTAKDYKLEGSVEFAVEEELDEYVEEVLMRLHTDNGFPIDVIMQVYLEDSTTNQIIDSLFMDDLVVLSAASIDSDGRTEGTAEVTKDILFTSERIAGLRQANRLRYVAYFNTRFESGNQPDIKIYEDYEMLIQFGIQAKILFDEEL